MTEKKAQPHAAVPFFCIHDACFTELQTGGMPPAAGGFLRISVNGKGAGSFKAVPIIGEKPITI